MPLLQELMGQLDHLQEIQEEELEVLDRDWETATYTTCNTSQYCWPEPSAKGCISCIWASHVMLLTYMKSCCTFINRIQYGSSLEGVITNFS